MNIHMKKEAILPGIKLDIQPNNFEGQGMGDEEQELDGDNEEQYMEGDPNEQYQDDEQEQGDEQYQGDADEQDEEN